MEFAKVLYQHLFSFVATVASLRFGGGAECVLSLKFDDFSELP